MLVAVPLVWATSFLQQLQIWPYTQISLSSSSTNNNISIILPCSSSISSPSSSSRSNRILIEVGLPLLVLPVVLGVQQLPLYMVITKATLLHSRSSRD